MTAPLEKNRSGKTRWLYAAFSTALFLIAAAIAWNFYAIRSAARCFARSHTYKAVVLTQASVTGELKPIEWDGWGWAGQDTTVYLVFDPTDSLSTAAREHQPGKFNGIPCEVPVVDRMEKNWYAVRFYTNEWWGALNCTGSEDH